MLFLAIGWFVLQEYMVLWVKVIITIAQQNWKGSFKQ